MSDYVPEPYHAFVVLVPGMVLEFNIEYVGSDFIEVSWFAPLQRNGVVGYILGAEDIETETAVSRVVIEPTHITTSDDNMLGMHVGGLVGNRTYELSVQVYNLKHKYVGEAVTLRKTTVVGSKLIVLSVLLHDSLLVCMLRSGSGDIY